MNNKLIVIHNYIFNYHYSRDKFIYLPDSVRSTDMILPSHATGKQYDFY